MHSVYTAWWEISHHATKKKNICSLSGILRAHFENFLFCAFCNSPTSSNYRSLLSSTLGYNFWCENLLFMTWKFHWCVTLTWNLPSEIHNKFRYHIVHYCLVDQKNETESKIYVSSVKHGKVVSHEFKCIQTRWNWSRTCKILILNKLIMTPRKNHNTTVRTPMVLRNPGKTLTYGFDI